MGAAPLATQLPGGCDRLLKPAGQWDAGEECKSDVLHRHQTAFLPASPCAPLFPTLLCPAHLDRNLLSCFLVLRQVCGAIRALAQHLDRRVVVPAVGVLVCRQDPLGKLLLQSRGAISRQQCCGYQWINGSIDPCCGYQWIRQRLSRQVMPPHANGEE